MKNAARVVELAGKGIELLNCSADAMRRDWNRKSKGWAVLVGDKWEELVAGQNLSYRQAIALRSKLRKAAAK